MTSASPPPRHERTRQLAIRLGLLAVILPVLVFTGSTKGAAAGVALRNPSANLVPTPDFRYSGTCTGSPGAWRCANPCVDANLRFPAYTDAPGCVAYVEQALASAWRHEGLRTLALPSDWHALTPPEQLFVLADLERTARGLPPYLGLNAALTREAQHAAATGSDPGLAPGFAVARGAHVVRLGGVWASGFTTLGADFAWMYDDGWGGATGTSNLACTSPRAAGCWGHRDELLGSAPRLGVGVGWWCRSCEMGAGMVVRDGTGSFADLVERPAGHAPAMTFTWARDVVPYLPASGAAARREQRRALAVARRDAVHGLWAPWNAAGTSGCPAAGTTPRSARRGCRHDLTTGRHPAGSLNKEER